MHGPELTMVYVEHDITNIVSKEVVWNLITSCRTRSAERPPQAISSCAAARIINTKLNCGSAYRQRRWRENRERFIAHEGSTHRT